MEDQRWLQLTWRKRIGATGTLQTSRKADKTDFTLLYFEERLVRGVMIRRMALS